MPCDVDLLDRSLVTEDPVVMVHGDLLPTPGATRDARALVTAALGDVGVGLPPDVVWKAELLTTELVTNGVLHARTNLHVGVIHDQRTLLIAVADGHGSTPPARDAACHPDDESGRGMTIVAGLADGFGWRPRTDAPGKIMWATLALTGTASPEAAAV